VAKQAKVMSETLLKSVVGALLKKDKLEVRTAEMNVEGDGIKFTALSETGQLSVAGVFRDPQEELPLEEDDGESDGADA
jgi:hypothetical protein